MGTLDRLCHIEGLLAGGTLPEAAHLWDGADVVISSRPKSDSASQSFYPAPRYVVSKHALELSTLFEALRDAFSSRLNSQTKVEFFGRLANAANRCLGKDGSSSANKLCAAVLHEAFAIYDEMEEHTFQSFPVAIGNEIIDDYVDDALREGFIGTENTRKFFLERGVDIEAA